VKEEQEVKEAQEKLISAINDRDINTVRKIIDLHNSQTQVLNSSLDENGRTPLFVATQKGQLEVVRLLLDAGANVDKADSDGWTPLQIASQKGHLDIVRVLVEEGADKDKVDSWGRTPLSVASQNGHLEIVRLLVDAGADKDKANSWGSTPLDIAKKEGYTDIINYLEGGQAPTVPAAPTGTQAPEPTGPGPEQLPPPPVPAVPAPTVPAAPAATTATAAPVPAVPAPEAGPAAQNKLYEELLRNRQNHLAPFSKFLNNIHIKNEKDDKTLEELPVTPDLNNNLKKEKGKFDIEQANKDDNSDSYYYNTLDGTSKNLINTKSNSAKYIKYASYYDQKMIESLIKHSEIVKYIDSNYNNFTPDLTEVRNFISLKMSHFDRNINNILSNSIGPALGSLCNIIFNTEGIDDSKKKATINNIRNRSCYSPKIIDNENKRKEAEEKIEKDINKYATKLTKPEKEIAFELYKKLSELYIFYKTYYNKIKIKDIEVDTLKTRPLSAPGELNLDKIKIAWKGGKSTKRRRGGKELTEEEITDLLNVENIDKDIADVLEINKKFGILRERLQDLSGNWESYKSTYPIKEFKDLQPKELINTLSEIDINFTFNKLDDSEIESLKKTIAEGVNKLSDVKDQKERYPLEKNIQELKSELKEKTKIFNEEKSKQDSLKKIFNPTFNKLIPLLSNISTFTTQDIEKYSELANKLKGVYEEQTAQPQQQLQPPPPPQIEETQPQSEGQSGGGYTKEDISTANEYINEISRKYGEIEGYSKEDLEAIYKTLSTDLNTTKEEIKTEITEIRDEIKEIMKDMSGYGEKYADINIQIKQNVYKLLEEQDEKLKILIVEKLNSLERELLGEIEIYYKNIKKNAIASGIPEIDLNPRTDSYSSESPYGSLYEKERIEFKGDRETEFDEDNDDDEYKGGADEETFLSKIKEKREIIDELFEESIEVEMKKLQSLIDVFITNVKRVKDPSYLLTLNGQDSIFNKIFNKYLEDRQNADKGEYVASNELVEGIKSNKVLPREILKIDFRDKAIFIFVTMFIRLISLSIVNLLIDRGNVKSLASTIIAFLTAYSVLFIVFVLIVNIDTYKLRIIFNYVNMHINSSILFTYPIIVWLFGAAIYYIMMNVNEGEKIVASSDEDRLRLQYKLETLSMILWVFVSILILVF